MLQKHSGQAPLRERGIGVVENIRFLFPRLRQGSRPSSAGEQPRKGDGGSREKK
jgi:hypothetical protein